MLCQRNDDVTYYALFIACFAACKKVSCHELAVASMQRKLLDSKSERRNLLAIGATKRAYRRPTSGWQRLAKMQAKSFRLVPWKVKVKVVNLYSASSCIHTSNALFVTNQSRRSHSHRVQPANTGWRTGQPGSPVSCTTVPTFRNPYKWVTTHLTDPGGMAGWVGLVGWLTADAAPTKWSSSHPSV